MTTTDKPSPATLKPCPFCGEKLKDHDEARWALHPSNGCVLGSMAIDRDGRWNTRPLGLHSSCSSSHQEIRYTGDACPLCEALKEVAACDGHAYLRDEINRLEDLIVHYSSTSFVGGSMLDESFAIKDRRAALSRPSEAPAPMLECLPHGQGRIGCWQEQLVGGEWVTNHSTACPTLKPGAGEEGKP